MFSGFDALVTQLKYFDVQETAKFDAVCGVVEFVIAELLHACLQSFHTYTGVPVPPIQDSTVKSLLQVRVCVVRVLWWLFFLHQVDVIDMLRPFSPVLV